MPIEFEPIGPIYGTPSTPAPAKNDPDKPSPEIAVGGAKPERSLPDSVKERLAALRDGPPPKVANDPKPADGVSTSPPKAEEAEPANENEAPTSEEKPPAPAEWETERDELRAVLQRQRDIIAKHEADLEAARKQSNETESARYKRLEEAENTYVRNPVAAIKAQLAAVLGVEPDSEDVKRELADLYIDLTSELTGASLDPAHQAKRTSDLTRREWDRTTKRREAGEKKQAEAVTPNEPGDPLKQAVEFIAAPFKSIADKFPHLMDFAQEFDRTDPAEVVADILLKGLKRGDFSSDDDTDKAVERAAKLADDHYKRRFEAIQGKAAKRKPSTATPGVTATKQDTPAAEPTKTVERQGSGRGLSNADASVAPSKTPSTTTQDKPPKFKTDKERAAWATRRLRPDWDGT